MAETTITDTTTRAVRAAYFVSDSTGITAETLGNALLANFPGMVFVKHTVPFVDSVDAATTMIPRSMPGVHSLADSPFRP